MYSKSKQDIFSSSSKMLSVRKSYRGTKTRDRKEFIVACQVTQSIELRDPIGSALSALSPLHKVIKTYFKQEVIKRSFLICFNSFRDPTSEKRLESLAFHGKKCRSANIFSSRWLLADKQTVIFECNAREHFQIIFGEYLKF